ncbi:cytochrome C biogenesis protein CycX [Skermanella stibiiresistens SB22]|uniref:Heme exporter protein D n=1 Tax=Skermanella stibiiresistens SB22 TaxID=1385369 RepID=W9HER9_9PROT|nr:heme exporter protein CcmD [Skermanella stibiiresistens]EWY42403.1 cytochrome C biogenesis protein CycX [Skermanella stibiiresistens SB22]
MAEFFSMGGYAAYVWPAYGVAAVFLVGMLIVSLRGLRRHESLLKTLEATRPRRRERTRRDGAPAPGALTPGAPTPGAPLPAAEGNDR